MIGWAGTNQKRWAASKLFSTINRLQQRRRNHEEQGEEGFIPLELYLHLSHNVCEWYLLFNQIHRRPRKWIQVKPLGETRVLSHVVLFRSERTLHYHISNYFVLKATEHSKRFGFHFISIKGHFMMEQVFEKWVYLLEDVRGKFLAYILLINEYIITMFVYFQARYLTERHRKVSSERSINVRVRMEKNRRSTVSRMGPLYASQAWWVLDQTFQLICLCCGTKPSCSSNSPF